MSIFWLEFYSLALSKATYSILQKCYHLFSQSINQGPEVQHSTLWNVTKEKHRPKASSFKVPENFDELLAKQVYGPSTKVAQNTVRFNSDK